LNNQNQSRIIFLYGMDISRKPIGFGIRNWQFGHTCGGLSHI